MALFGKSVYQCPAAQHRVPFFTAFSWSHQSDGCLEIWSIWMQWLHRVHTPKLEPTYIYRTWSTAYQSADSECRKWQETERSNRNKEAIEQFLVNVRQFLISHTNKHTKQNKTKNIQHHHHQHHQHSTPNPPNHQPLNHQNRYFSLRLRCNDLGLLSTQIIAIALHWVHPRTWRLWFHRGKGWIALGGYQTNEVTLIRSMYMVNIYLHENHTKIKQMTKCKKNLRGTSGTVRTECQAFSSLLLGAVGINPPTKDIPNPIATPPSNFTPQQK